MWAWLKRLVASDVDSLLDLRDETYDRVAAILGCTRSDLLSGHVVLPDAVGLVGERIGATQRELDKASRDLSVALENLAHERRACGEIRKSLTECRQSVETYRVLSEKLHAEVQELQARIVTDAELSRLPYLKGEL